VFGPVLAASVLLWTAPPAPSQASARAALDDPPGYDGDALLPRSWTLGQVPTPVGKKLGLNTTLFVNFDGVELGDCEPSDSHRNCSWIRPDSVYEAWSGSLQTKLAIMASARKRLARYGIRVTGLRPSDSENYTMIVYGGDADEEGVLGLAPSGDCNDARPNQVAFAFLDGARRTWSSGGGTTLVHEAGHTWGLDHIDDQQAVMNPFGDNKVTEISNRCDQIVLDAELTPGESRCPELAMEHCGSVGQQHAAARLIRLFGAPYVDTSAPILTLTQPFDGWYEQGPGADIPINVEIWDDLHPQTYQIEIDVEGLFDDPVVMEDSNIDFELNGLPLGNWHVQIRAWDEAGNRGELGFDLEVGERPRDELPLDDGCNCRVGEDSDGAPRGAWLLILAGMTLARAPRER
jgi:MYXO-CTERM domain-containing protein